MKTPETQKPETLGADAPDATESMRELTDRASDSKPPEFEVSFLSICRAMSSSLQLDEVLQQILDLTVREMSAQQGSILLFDEHKDRLGMLASHGLPKEIVGKGYIDRKGSIAEWVIQHDEPLILNDRAKGKDFEALDKKRQIVSSMCFPLRARGEVLGTINLNRTDLNLPAFADEDLEGMDILASQAAICIQNSRLHESCVQSERLAAIGQTVAGISHCIKNLLTGLQGGVSLVRLAGDQQNWGISEQALEVLDHSTTRISSLILDMLEYSKAREPDKDEVDLKTLLNEVAEVTRKKAEEQSGVVNLEIAEDATKVFVDGHQIFRCLLNLIQNALDATGEGNNVYVSTERSQSDGALNRLTDKAESAILIRIRDEGTGISEENRSQIFEPFFSTKGSRGTGLGLAVTRKIISEHGGTIEVASKTGEPAEFVIYLPA